MTDGYEFDGTIENVKLFERVLDEDEREAQLEASMGIDDDVCDWFDIPGLGRAHVLSYEGRLYINGKELEPADSPVPQDTSWHQLQAFYSKDSFAVLVDGQLVAGTPEAIPEEDDEM